MTYEVTDSGYVIRIKEEHYPKLLAYFETTDDEIQNVIKPGDFERTENILDLSGANEKFSHLYKVDLMDDASDIGIWYIRAARRSPEKEQVIKQAIGLANPSEWFLKFFRLELLQ